MAQEDILIPSSGIRDLGAKSTDKSALPQTINQLSLSINSKVSGYFPLVEMQSGRFWYPDPTKTALVYPSQVWRPGKHKVVFLGALENAAGTHDYPHGITITDTTFFIEVYGVANDQAAHKYLPMPYSSATANDVIEVWVEGANIKVKIGKDLSAYTNSFIVLEWLDY
jgi:hypothetical protein